MGGYRRLGWERGVRHGKGGTPPTEGEAWEGLEMACFGEF